MLHGQVRPERGVTLHRDVGIERTPRRASAGMARASTAGLTPGTLNRACPPCAP